ncbi:flagellar protein FlaG [Methylobacterium organophilum]|uniref:flagellar protein FlaG n=1 Tax=Methylobacterium organophilum TaxID=410 RepID=UPI001F12CED0|nr:flagellar protein FlaG [Methylobacterium organophilum]UMY16201.1 flagellar protein FlaG [Methylobacterium organophilum]
MDAIRPISTPAPTPSVASAAESRPTAQVTSDTPNTSRQLAPAVSIEINPENTPAANPAPAASTEKRGFERDPESQAIVYRVTDAATGDVLVQIPDEVVLRARAYARDGTAQLGQRIAKFA